MLQLVEGTNIYRHVITPPLRGVQPNAPMPPAPKASPAKSPGIFAAKGPASKGKAWKFLSVEFGHPIFVSWLFFLPQKNGTCIFCCRFSVLEVAGTAPKPPQTYAERLQILDRIGWWADLPDSLRSWFIPPLASQSVSFANFQLLWSWTYQCIILSYIQFWKNHLFFVKTIFPW